MNPTSSARLLVTVLTLLTHANGVSCPEREMSFFSPKLYCLYVRNVHLNCMKIAVQCPIVFRNFACGALDKLSTFSPKFRFSLLTMTLMRLRLVVRSVCERKAQANVGAGRQRVGQLAGRAQAQGLVGGHGLCGSASGWERDPRMLGDHSPPRLPSPPARDSAPANAGTSSSNSAITRRPPGPAA